MVSFSRRTALVGAVATAGGAAAIVAAATRPGGPAPDDDGPDENTRAHEAQLMEHLYAPALD